VVVIWEGAEPRPQPSPEIEIIRMPVPTPAETAATAIWNAVDHSTRRDIVEPMTIARAELELWSRPPGPPSPSAMPADEGDRRWLWMSALVLLAAEHGLRRARTGLARHEAREQQVA
jgi:hypothetical protein